MSTRAIKNTLQGIRRLRIGHFGALGAAVAAYLACPFRISVVEGPSMQPTLASGTVCILNRTAYARHPVRRGDIVLFRRGADVYVKRVYAGPGDRVTLLHYRDGSYLVPKSMDLTLLRRTCQRRVAAELLDVTVPAGQCFVLGDNARNSYDSRAFGFLDTRQVLGKIVAPLVRASGQFAQAPPDGDQPL